MTLETLEQPKRRGRPPGSKNRRILTDNEVQSLAPKKRGRPVGSKNKPRFKFTPLETPSRAELPRQVYLDDGNKQRDRLVGSWYAVKCTCGGKLIEWNDKKKPDIAAFCPSNAHGGNGKFWLYEEAELLSAKKRGGK